MKYFETKKVTDSHYDVIFSSNQKLVGKFILDVDGFFYFWPEREDGAWSAWSMKEIASMLDEMNAEWEQHIEEYFEKNPPNENETSEDISL
jgi:hypothetical protein